MEIFKNVNSYQNLLEMNTSEFLSNAKYSVTLHLQTASTARTGVHRSIRDAWESRYRIQTRKKSCKKKKGPLFTRFAGPLPFPLSPLCRTPSRRLVPTTSLLFTFCPSLLTAFHQTAAAVWSSRPAPPPPPT